MMLRTALLVASAGASLVGLVLCLVRVPVPGIQLLVFGVITLLALSFERWRYRTRTGGAVGAWQRTGERFEDPETGRILDVEYNPESGERRYIDRDGAQATVRRS
jgi:hypothetical protein